MLAGNLGIEEKSGTGVGLLEEVGRGTGNEIEDGEAGAGFQHEQGNNLLEEESNDDSGPEETRCRQLRISEQPHDQSTLTKEHENGASRHPTVQAGRRRGRGR